MTVPYVAGISAIGDFRIAGFRYSGWIWAAMLASGGLLILGRKGRIRFPVMLWMPWFGFVMLSLLWVRGHGLGNLQDACQIATPLVVGSVASMSIRSERDLRRLRRAFLHCVIIAWAGYAASLSGWFGTFVIAERAMAMMACFAGCVFAISVSVNPVWSLVGWVACMGLAFFTGSRTAMVVLLLLWAAHPLALLVFYSPTFPERSFGPEGGSVSDVFDGEFESAGRFENWPEIWEQAQEHLVLGAGVGEVGKFVSSIWEGTDKPHNDYLRIVFEQGLMGLALFLVVVGLQVHRLRGRIPRCTGEVRIAFAVAYLGLIVLLLVAVTDNPITYGVWYMHPLFAVLGAGYGVSAEQAAGRLLPAEAGGGQ
jgi:O-antigen ligase